MTTHRTLIVLIGLLASVPAAAQQVPHCFFYHGTLTNAAGDPLSTSRAMVFSIWSQPSGGTKFWEETHSAVAIAQGHFSVMLGGSGTPIPSSVFSDTLRYLQITVGGETLTPRQRIGSVPFAYAAASGAALALPYSGESSLSGSAFRVHNSSTRLLIGSTNSGGSFSAATGAGVVASGPTGAIATGSSTGVRAEGGSEGVRGTHTGSGNYGVVGGATSSVYGKTSGGSVSGGPHYAGFFEGVGDYSCGLLAKSGRFGYGGDFWGPVVVRNRTGTRVLEMGEGLDYAEGFDVSSAQTPAPGTVLVLDDRHPGRLTPSTSAYDARVAGIVAGAGGLGSGISLGAADHAVSVALAGRVYCCVDATDGEIRVGDLLTTSSTPGHAMRASERDRAGGAILGKAMEPLPQGRKGLILVLVTLQ